MFYNFVLMLPAAACLFWAVLLFLNWSRNVRSQKVLAISALMVSLAFLNLANYVVGITDYKFFYILDILDPAVFIPPTMYLYFKAMTSEKPFRWHDYIWFIPPLAIEGTILVLYQIMGVEQAIQLAADVLSSGVLPAQYADPVYKIYYLIGIQVYNWTGLALFIGINIYALVSIGRYHYRLRDFDSVLEDKSIGRDYSMLIWFLLSTAPGIVLFALHRGVLEGHPTLSICFFLSLTVVAFCLCYDGYRMQYSVEHFAHDLEQSSDQTTENTAGSRDDGTTDKLHEGGRFQTLAELFCKLIDEDKIFLQKTLRADEVAHLMHTNRTYVSRMVRDEFHTNFSDYINGKRIEFAKELMRIHPEMRLSDLAEASGFINAQSFCRMFRQIEGTTPKGWQKESIRQ